MGEMEKQFWQNEKTRPGRKEKNLKICRWTRLFLKKE